MRFCTATEVRSQLQAIAQAKSEAEAWSMFMDPKRTAIGAYCKANEKRTAAGMDVREAAKLALEQLSGEKHEDDQNHPKLPRAVVSGSESRFGLAPKPSRPR